MTTFYHFLRQRTDAPTAQIVILIFDFYIFNLIIIPLSLLFPKVLFNNSNVIVR